MVYISSMIVGNPVSISMAAMTMRKDVFMCVFVILAYIGSVNTSLETVWLTDVSTRFQTDKRTLRNLDLPNNLAFHLRRGSDHLTLHLKRNYAIDPNADVYFARTSKSGQSVLVKSPNLEQGDIAYYQDISNEAFMTVRCVRRSNEQCDRVINGNLRIRDRSLDLRPVETDDISRNVFEVPVLLGKRYVLQDKGYIQRETFVGSEDAPDVDDKHVEQQLTVLLKRFKGQLKQNLTPDSDATLSSRNIAYLHDRGSTDKSRQLKNVYNVKVAVLIDSRVWNLYSSTVATVHPVARIGLVKWKITEAYSHIMNGVNLRYKTIEDSSISINVILSRFIFFQERDLYPHKPLNVTVYKGTTYINSELYLANIASWDIEVGGNHIPSYDVAMLFTIHHLYLNQDDVSGLTLIGQICDIGNRTSIVMAGDYIAMVWVAAHELGHSLGSWHDGENDSIDCKSEDLFIMSLKEPKTDPRTPFSRNSFTFSNCSVESFKKTLIHKQCVKEKGGFYNYNEYNRIISKQPGQLYTPNDQCYFANRGNSTLCETFPQDICHLMRCTDPNTGDCMEHYFGAARGTKCGETMGALKEGVFQS